MGQSKRLFEEQAQDTAADSNSSHEVIWHTDSLWQSKSQAKLLPALLRFHQKDIRIVKDRTVPVGGGKTRSYTTLDEIIAKVKPALAEEGLIIHQHLAGSEVITMLVHISGEFMASKVGFTPMNGTNVNNLQAAGGGLTYLKRYAISALLNINSDEDDDAASAEMSVLPTLPDTKLPEIKTWLNNGGSMVQIRAKYQLTALQIKYLTED